MRSDDDLSECLEYARYALLQRQMSIYSPLALLKEGRVSFELNCSYSYNGL